METLFLNYNQDPDITNKASSILKNGGIGIFPTDTVYGIGCNALDITGLEKLYHIKGRDFNKPINILVSNPNMINKFVKNINHVERKLIENFWPGALTIIFNKSKIVPKLLTAGLDTVGIRMPNNKIAIELIDRLGYPIATSSANISGEIPATNIYFIKVSYLFIIFFITFIIKTSKKENRFACYREPIVAERKRFELLLGY